MAQGSVKGGLLKNGEKWGKIGYLCKSVSEKWQARPLLVPLKCHCERSEAISTPEGDCFVAPLLAMTESDEFSDTLSEPPIKVWSTYPRFPPIRGSAIPSP